MIEKISEEPNKLYLRDTYDLTNNFLLIKGSYEVTINGRINTVQKELRNYYYSNRFVMSVLYNSKSLNFTEEEETIDEKFEEFKS